ncbi:MAG TPA: DUF2950 domain-containing protein [Usitatibacter sp.]|nr:DUF2950 domain-containing protein [Usitatibacter sp.]
MKIRKSILLGAACAALAASLSPSAYPQPEATPAAAKSTVKQRTFATPAEAAKALAEAARAKKVQDLLAIVGPGSASWLFSGDMVADANDWAKFVAAYDEKNGLDSPDANRAVLQVGNDAWPFPAPIVKHGATWSFDANAGREEILNRRVGRNELDAMQTMLAIVDAQREYAQGDADGNGYADYALRFRSTPGKKDGLFWPSADGEPQSPLGPLVAVAAKEGYGKQAKGAKREAYHGYYYRILTAQGKNAPGGAYDYMVKGKLLGGFAVVAWPANYGSSGVMSFLVNHDGVVYEKDLGAQTNALASSMSVYNPDATWRKSQ